LASESYSMNFLEWFSARSDTYTPHDFLLDSVCMANIIKRFYVTYATNAARQALHSLTKRNQTLLKKLQTVDEKLEAAQENWSNEALRQQFSGAEVLEQLTTKSKGQLEKDTIWKVPITSENKELRLIGFYYKGDFKVLYLDSRENTNYQVLKQNLKKLVEEAKKS